MKIKAKIFECNWNTYKKVYKDAIYRAYKKNGITIDLKAIDIELEHLEGDTIQAQRAPSGKHNRTISVYEDGTIKYIDYDLDLRVFPSGEYKILDRMEYKYHKKIMKYSNELDYVIRNSLTELINLYKKGYFSFDSKLNLHYYDEYKILNVQAKESA